MSVKRVMGHHSDEAKTPLDQAIKDAGFHLWVVSDPRIVPFEEEPEPREVVWEPLGGYQTTARIVERMSKVGLHLASPRSYLRALGAMSALLKATSYVCIFKVETEGLGKSGYAALLANQDLQRTLGCYSIGDGWAQNCVIAAYLP